jgi:hypothetical protein
MFRKLHPELKRGRKAERTATVLYYGLWLVLLAAVAQGIRNLRL